MDLVKQLTLETILRECEQLLRLARQTGDRNLGRRIEDVLHECRAVLTDSGRESAEGPPRNPAAVVKLMPRKSMWPR